ncbi:hypothetical protein RUND412_002061 [Rhizina undulata]
MSLNLPAITAPFITRARYIEETLNYVLLNTSKLYSQILAPPPHSWTAVAYFKIAHADLRQFMSTHLSEEAQILEKRGKREYSTDAERAEAMEIYQEGFDVVRALLNYVDEDIRVMTAIAEIVRWNFENRGMGTAEGFWQFLNEELALSENIDPVAGHYVVDLLEVTVANGLWD